MGNSARQSKLLPNTDQSGKDERRGDSQVPALARRAPGLSMLVVPAGPGSLGGLFLGCYVVTEILTDLTECFRHVAEFGVLCPPKYQGIRTSPDMLPWHVALCLGHSGCYKQNAITRAARKMSIYFSQLWRLRVQGEGAGSQRPARALAGGSLQVGGAFCYRALIPPMGAPH